MSNLPKSVVASSQQKRSVLEKLGAVFAIDAKYSKAGEQWVLNRGSGGQQLKAKYGSVARAEIRSGVGLVTPSSSGNTASVPDSAILRISGPLEICGRFEGSTRQATTGYLAIKSSDGTYANRWYSVVLYNSGQLGIWCRDTAMNAVDKGSVSAIPSNVTAFWWKVTVNPTTGAHNFYYAADQASEPTNWTDLGGATGTFVGSAILTGSGGDVRGHHLLDGVQKRLIIRNGIGGTTVLDVDFTNQADLATSFTCTTGQTVTVTAANAVDTNDPLLLDWSGRSYVYCPGTVGNLISSGWPAPAHGSATYTVKWRPEALGGFQPIAGTDSTYGGFILNGTNRLGVYARDASTAFIGDSAGNSTPIPGIANGVDIWLRGRVTASSALCEYWYSYDATDIESEVNWISLGTFVGFNAGATISPRSTLHWGSYSSGLAGPPGRFYAGSFEADGVVHSAWRMINGAPTPYVGQPVTVNRSATGRKTAVVTRPIWLFGTDDYMEVADNDLLDFPDGQDFSVVAVARCHSASHTGYVFTKKADGLATAGWAFGHNAGSILSTFGDGTTQSTIATSPAFTAGNLNVLTVQVSGDTARNFVNSLGGSTVSHAGLGSLASTTVMKIGNLGGNQLAGDFELLAVGIFRRTLSAAEVAQIVSAYRTS